MNNYFTGWNWNLCLWQEI